MDRVLSIREQNKPLPEIELFAVGKELMLIGSMRKEDIKIVINFVQQHSELKFIIAPHEITEAMMKPLEEELDSTIRHSNLDDSTAGHQVLIVDNIGMLSQLYRYANYAYIGGGFSDGIHNILEPAVYEIPVFFGNKAYQRFKEAIDLIEIGAAFPIGSFPEFKIVFKDLVGNRHRLVEIKDALTNYLADNQGASEKIIGHLKSTLS
jgi:3-deoxy-D-manno-octulosonic-acid transferase